MSARNPRISKKEMGLIKGALRRVFSRSDLRRKVLEAGIVEHHDPKRKRVKTWVKCEGCGVLEAKSNIDIDHKIPVIAITSSLAEMDVLELVNAMWCDESNLQRLCTVCHDAKSASETKQRAAFKKGKKK